MKTSQIEPMWLYHGTSKERLLKIIKEGLKPHADTGNNFWLQVLHEHPTMVYLTAGYAPYLGVNTPSSHNSQFGMVRIDFKALDQTKLYPDELYLVHDTGLIPSEFTEFEQKYEWARANLHLYQNLWRESLARMGNCCYQGTIPTSAMNKAVVVDMKTGCGKPFKSMLFKDALYGEINTDYYAKNRNRLDRINYYLFKEPFDVEWWTREFFHLSPSDTLWIGSTTKLNMLLTKYADSIKELNIYRPTEPSNCITNDDRETCI